EGFNLGRFTRSMIVGVLAAVGAQAALKLPLPATSALVVLFGLAYAIERGLVEVWKTFLREEDQSKYFIPMQFSMRGVPVKSRMQRLACGAGYVGIIALCFFAIGRLDQRPAAPPSMATAALVGL